MGIMELPAMNKESNEYLGKFLSFDNEPDRMKYVMSITKCIKVKETLKDLEEAMKLKKLGEKAHTTGDFTKAVKLYTQALQLAPFSRDHFCQTEMDVLYVDRSTALSDMNEYPASHRDIERCLKIQQCQEQIEEEEVDSAHRKLLIGISGAEKMCSLEEEFVGDSIEMRRTDEKGRHVVAKENIKTGTILVVERAYCTGLSTSAWSTHCYNCYKALPIDPVPCYSCTQVLYCSCKCEAASWAHGHQFECNHICLLKHIFSQLNCLPAVYHIALKAGFQQMMSMATGSKSEVTPDYKEFCSLIGHHPERGDGSRYFQTCMAAFLAEGLKRCGNFFPTGSSCGFHDNSSYSDGVCEECFVVIGLTLLEHLEQCHSNGHCIEENSHHVSSDSPLNIGIGIFPKISLMFNHSCDQNAIQINRGHTEMIQTIRPIAEGEEITYSYNNFRDTSKEGRQRYLFDNYCFVCNCAACINGWENIDADLSLDTDNLDDIVDSTSLSCTSCGEKLMSVVCYVCGKKYDLKSIKSSVAEAMKNYMIIKNGKNGEPKERLSALIDVLEVLHNTVGPLNKLHSAVQKDIVQILSKVS